MTTLAANKKRVYEFNADPIYNDVPMIASDVIYEGAAVGESSSSGNARPLEGGDNFLGFATAKADNASGSAGDVNVRVRSRGIVKLSVTGVSADDDLGATVYATDDDTFTLTASGGSSIGKVHRWISGTTCMVAFESVLQRSI